MKAIYVLPTTQRATPLAPHVKSVRVPRALSIDNAAGGLCGMHVEAQQQIEKERRLQSKDQTPLLNDAVSRDALESLKQYSLSVCVFVCVSVCVFVCVCVCVCVFLPYLVMLSNLSSNILFRYASVCMC